VIDAEAAGYGTVIRAVAPGETVMQTLTGDGFRDVARVTVVPKETAVPKENP
jgi:hypothetical protein